MEIKIKDLNGYIEADWTIENGVMIVSPKKEKIDLSQFKDGDILYCSWGGDRTAWVVILKGGVEYMDNTHVSMEDYCSLFLTGDKKFEVEGYSDSATHIRHATEEERNKLFQALADNGLEWDVKEQKLVKVKWKPKVGDVCCYPLFVNDDLEWEVSTFKYEHQVDIDNDLCILRGWVFNTEAECQALVDKLNQAIENVKP